MSEKEYKNTLSFWRAVEALSPQEVPKLKKNDKKNPGANLGEEELAPWLDEQFLHLPVEVGKEWSFTVFGGLIEREDQVRALAKVLGPVEDVFDERLNGVSCLFSLRLNAAGRVNAESFVLSMSAWATGVVIRSGLQSLSNDDAFDGSGLHRPEEPIEHPSTSSGLLGFDLQSKALRDELAWRVTVLPDDEPVTMKWLHEFAGVVAEKCYLMGLFEGVTPMNRVTAFQVSTKKRGEPSKQEEEIINSFFIRDLNRAVNAGWKGASAPLRSFSRGETPDESKRIDVRQNREKVVARLEPKCFPLGCWPSEHPLVWSQQLAVNSAWQELRADDGLFSVNGPPGTGKTTLLRDFVAAIVVERALALRKVGANAFGHEKEIKVGNRTLVFHPLTPSVSGHTIVVASSNNGAVENLSLELPLLKAVDPKWLEGTDFFRDLATRLLGEPAWGLLAGKLGNSGNRQQFSSRFYWSKVDTDGVSGMKEFLEAASRPGFKARLSFEQARKNFESALARENALREQLQAFCDLPVLLDAGERELTLLNNEVLSGKRATLQARARQEDAAESNAAAQAAFAESLREFEAHSRLKPGLFETLLSFGRTVRPWRERATELSDAHDRNKVRRSAASGELEMATRQLKSSESAVFAAMRKLEKTEGDHEIASKLFGRLSPIYSKLRPDLGLRDEEIERSSPWSDPEWQEARIKVFLGALDLHRAFVEANPEKMLDNLSLAADMLTKGLPSSAARVAALDSLALVCPVISTAFASVSAMFGEIDSPAIGWLMIDEAGQAPPQASVGALWRSKRAVVVGDPLQLEPVVTIPHSIEALLAAHYGVTLPDLFPTATSVQRLADIQMEIGTTIGRTKRDSVWVGAPLRVHRRCDDPMFGISNTIAYGGLMVHQKTPSKLRLPPSTWIDVPPGISPNGHWLPSEGDALAELLSALLFDNPGPRPSIFLVSPFKDVVGKLSSFVKDFGLDSRMVGTVHTTQGKEAEVTILVLGGGTSGARNWAAERPNLLNVAVSRAKSRLYVIGDKADWGKRNYFDELARRT